MASPIDFIAGCLGGAAGVLVGHPLDTIKVLMQTSTKRVSMKSLIADSSFFSLYRGLTAPLTGLAAINAIVFGVYGSLMRNSIEPSLLWHATAGSIAGISQSVITCPMELVKTRAQLTSSSVLSCFRQVIHKEGGSRGLYRGLMATIARDAPAFATYFSCFELILRLSKTSSSYPPSTLLLLLAGGTAGALSWVVIYPIDVIKSRIQADIKFTSIRHCFRESLSEEGVNVFVRGAAPTLVRAFPTNAATFGVVTYTLYYYEGYICEDHQTKNGENLLE